MSAFISTDMQASDEGLLYPVIKDMNVHFGYSSVEADGWLRKLFFYQSFNLVKYVA